MYSINIVRYNILIFIKCILIKKKKLYVPINIISCQLYLPEQTQDGINSKGRNSLFTGRDLQQRQTQEEWSSTSTGRRLRGQERDTNRQKHQTRVTCRGKRKEKAKTELRTAFPAHLHGVCQYQKGEK